MNHFLLRKQEKQSENIHSFLKENTFQPNEANKTAGSLNYIEISCLQSFFKKPKCIKLLSPWLLFTAIPKKYLCGEAGMRKVERIGRDHF